MLAKAVAHHTTAAFIRVVGSEFVQKYLGEVRTAAYCLPHNENWLCVLHCSLRTRRLWDYFMLSAEEGVADTV